MPETTTPAGATPAAAGATPAQTPSASEPPVQPATGPADDAALGEAGKRALEAERAARRDAEARAKAAVDELDKLKTAALSEDEKRQKHLADLEREQADWQRERQDLRLERIVERTAAKLGFRDPADALGLLDRASLDFDADGTPRNLEAQLSALAKSKAYLLTAATPAPSFDTGRGAGAAPGRTYSRAELRDTAFYAANRTDIEAAMREGRIRD